ncbi:hypothetical protein [Pseudomonas massiliensis]|uniref:hypothetical protein n=1 Tax=Pseudomonas massiliensis TaxID=522492 RepID=UPI00058DE156|nr:hypothetical protein [Pseudomonas massiliensis]
MDERFTPTGKRFAPVFSDAMRIINKSLANDEPMNFDDLKYITRLLIQSRDQGTDQDLIEIAFQGLEHVSKEHNGLSEQIRWCFTPLLLALMDASNEIACASISTEILRLKPLIEGNKTKNAIIERAKQIASEMWADDLSNEIKTSEMADMVWARLVDEGHSAQLPEHAARVRVWIRSVAPEYAKAKGRPKKRSA